MAKSLTTVIARALKDLPGVKCEITTAARSAYPLAMLDFDSLDTYFEAVARLRRCRSLHVDGNRYAWGAHVMFTEDRAAWGQAEAVYMAGIEEWWQRYHNADENTRRLMACGAIA